MTEIVRNSFPVLKEKELAELLHISFRKLQQLRREGKAPPHVMVGGQIRYVLQSVKEWLKENEIQNDN